MERVVGGLELALKFAHHEDRERVVHAARAVGWAPDFDLESQDWEETGLHVMVESRNYKVWEVEKELSKIISECNT